jgi:hypothetical protein
MVVAAQTIGIRGLAKLIAANAAGNTFMVSTNITQTAKNRTIVILVETVRRSYTFTELLITWRIVSK